MSLRYLVPTLGLIACTAGTINAADVGGLTVNGYVDTILAINSYGDEITPVPPAYYTAPGTGGEEASNMLIDWSAGFQIEPSYKIGNDVVATAELYFVDGTVDTQQAKIKWSINEMVDITMGKMHSPLGWEGADAPELYRVNFSNLYQGGIITAVAGVDGILGANDLTGVRVGFTGPKGSIQVSGGATFCDQVYTALVATDNSEFAFLADVAVAVENIGTFGAVLAYDMGTAQDPDDGKPSDVLTFDLTATLTMVKDLTIGAELVYSDMGVVSNIGFLGAANYKLPVDLPCSVTLMVDYLSISDESAGSNDSVSEMEIAAALLLNPTKDANFATNIEIRSISRDYEDFTGPDVDLDEFGVFFEMLAVIP